MAGSNHLSWNLFVLISGSIMGSLIASSHNFLTDRHLFRVEILLLIVSGLVLTIVRPERPIRVGLAIWLGYFVISEIREICIFIQPGTSANIPLPLPFIFFMYSIFFAFFGSVAFLGAWLGHLLIKAVFLMLD